MHRIVWKFILSMFRVFNRFRPELTRRFTEGVPLTMEDLRKAFKEFKPPEVTRGNVTTFGAALTGVNILVNAVMISASKASLKAELVQVGSELKISVTQESADLKVKTILLQKDADGLKGDVDGLKADVDGLKADVKAGFGELKGSVEKLMNKVFYMRSFARVRLPRANNTWFKYSNSMFRLFRGSRRFTERGPSFTLEELKKAFQDVKVPEVTWGNVMSIGAGRLSRVSIFS